ncbi:hypothetical protein ACHAXT_000647 [Thalassiosira profunda]
MPSRETRRLPKRPPKEEGDGDGDTSAGGSGLSHEPSGPMAPAADAADASSGPAADADQAIGGLDRLAASASADEHAGGEPSSSADPAQAFEPPTSARANKTPSPVQVEVQIRPASPSEPGDDTTSGPIPPIEGDAKPPASPAVKEAESAASAAEASSIHRAAFAPPVVTKTTRRETFGAAVPVRRKKKHEGKSLLQASSGSSEEDPMMDMFSPPPTSLRTRPRPRNEDVDLGHAVTESTSLDEHPKVTPGLERAHPLESESFETSGPPTIYTPHTAEGERMAVSTTQKGRYQGRVVHVPRKNGESHDEGEEEGGERDEALPQQQQSAPAKMPASKQTNAMASGGPLAQADGASHDFPPLTLAKGIGYDSNEDIHAALQLSFEDSPDTSPRDSQHRKAAEGMASPSKRARDSSHEPQPPGYPGYHPPSSYYPYPPGGQQPPGYPSPSRYQQPPSGYPPQWSSQGQQQPPGYYGYPAQGGYQHPPHYPEQPSPIGSRTPGGKRRSPKRSADATMETAEMSYDDTVGPMSPPSSKKKRDGASMIQSMGTWASPPRESDATPQRGSTAASRRRNTPPNASTPHSMQFNVHELHPTPSMSMGGSATEIFPAESWSPSHMQAFASFDDGETPAPEPRQESGSSVNVSGDSGNSNRISCSSGPHYEGSPDDSRPAFTSVLSPTSGGITIRGSPIHRRDGSGDDNADAQGPRAPRGQEGEAGAKSGPRRAWQTPSANTGMRIKIGQPGMESSEARRGIEGINSVLRGSPVEAPPMTPGLQYQYPANAAGGYAPTPNHRGGPPSAYKTPQPSKALSAAASAARQGGGKENADNAEPALPPPCNCKKSKCLKLYCDCFSAERYCNGCKCTNCQNTPAYESIRQKAIVDTKAKNPNAFKQKLSQNKSHATGCRCKKSGCLKKYCECFQGGIVCGAKCKCANCKNFVGSQALIDRRRKIKDHKGAEAAMQGAQEVWKGPGWKGSMSETKVGMRSSGLSFAKQSPIVHDPTRGPPGPYAGGMLMSPVGGYVGSPHGRPPPPGYPVPGMMQQSPFAPMRPGIAPMSAPPARYNRQPAPHRPLSVRRREPPPRDFGPTARYFGPDVEELPKGMAEKVLGYLSKDDLFCAAVVSKTLHSVVSMVIEGRR